MTSNTWPFPGLGRGWAADLEYFEWEALGASRNVWQLGEKNIHGPSETTKKNDEEILHQPQWTGFPTSRRTSIFSDPSVESCSNCSNIFMLCSDQLSIFVNFWFMVRKTVTVSSTAFHLFWRGAHTSRLQTPHHGGVRRADGQNPRRDGGARRGGTPDLETSKRVLFPYL